LVQGDDYGKELEDAVTTAVREKASAFEAAVRACLSIEVHDIGLNVVRVGKELGQMQGDMTKLLHSNASAQSLEKLLRDQLSQCESRHPSPPWNSV
jgi:predicted HD phosphohydrolase